jgi:16S rRNA (guanine527-N7)-methyltransferase
MSVSRETDGWKDEWPRLLIDALRSDTLSFAASHSERLVSFASMILDVNPVLGLISRRNPEREVVRQILDSLSIMTALAPSPGCTLLDVGSGAGIPGLVFRIVDDKLDLISLDSSRRKVDFQESVAKRISVRAQFVCSDFRTVDLNRTVDVVMSKAMGSHRALIKRANRWLKSGGMIVIPQSEGIDREIRAAVDRSIELEGPHAVPYHVPVFNRDLKLAMIYKK